MRRFIEQYVLLDLRDFPALEAEFPVGIVVLAVALALAVACFVTTWYRGNTALLLRRLLRAEALSEDSARTLSELGLSSRRGVAALLRRGSRSQLPVTSVERTRMTYDEYRAWQREHRGKREREPGPDVAELHWYIAEPQQARARRLYREDGSSLGKACLCAALILLLAVGLLLLLRPLLGWLAASVAA